jgi:hypothetical protein
MATATPFVKRMRTQGGTIYTFSSALEDIGLNINERNNIVKLSQYALLNLPSIDAPPNLQSNRFNVLAIPGAYESFLNSGSIKDGRIIIAESFQNYALNLEVNLLRQDSYNAALSTTISERVFWKWLKETGAIRWQPIDTSIGTYWVEEIDTDTSIGYSSVVKCFGSISAGSVRTDTFGTYNEAYVLVPTSFGQSPIYFKQVEDDNYYHGLSIIGGLDAIYGRESYIKPHPDALDYQAYYDLADSPTSVVGVAMSYDTSVGYYLPGWWYTGQGFPFVDDNDYYIDISTYLTSGVYHTDLLYTASSFNINYRRSNVDCMSIEFDVDNLRQVLNDPVLTLDDLAIDSKYVLDDRFDFNAILIYYSVYNKALDKVLATNLYGILFLDAPSGNTQDYPLNEIVLPSITKIQSGPTGFGTSYSFRLNVKSDYMLDDTAAAIYDESTTSQIVLEDFADVFTSLEKSLSILNQHSGTINYITNQYSDIAAQQTNIFNLLTDINNIVNGFAGLTGTENSVPLFNREHILIDSSIYMDMGRIGMFVQYPLYPVHIDVSVKTKDIILESNIYDIYGNRLFGYDGSVLMIGSSTGTIQFLTTLINQDGSIITGGGSGSGTCAITDASFNSTQFSWSGGLLYVDVSTAGGTSYLYVDSSLLARDASITQIFNTYVKQASLGSDFYWAGGLLQVDVSAASGGTYDPALSDSVAMPNDVGGLDAGTTVGDLRGLSYDDLWTYLLFPTIYPTYVAPSNAFTASISTLQEIGFTTLITFTNTLNRGQILLNGSFQNYRSGAGISYNYTGYGMSSPTGSNTQPITYTMTQGYQYWTGAATYSTGPQPLDSNGDPYGTPLASGTTAAATVTLEGVYPLFATSSVVTNPDTQQTLVSMITGNYVQINLANETSPPSRQSFDIPTAWTGSRPLTMIQTYNTISTAWENTGLAQWTTSSVTHDVQSYTIPYTRYTFNGAIRGTTLIRLIF